jgi:hypothetical protein
LAKFGGVVDPSTGDEAIALVADLLSVPAGERYPLPNLGPQRRKERALAALLVQPELYHRPPCYATENHAFMDAH